MCWFDLVIKCWGFLATSHDPINANDSSENKIIFCLGLLANFVGLLRPVGAGSIVLGILSLFSLMRYHPTG